MEKYLVKNSVFIQKIISRTYLQRFQVYFLCLVLAKFIRVQETKGVHYKYDRVEHFQQKKEAACL